MRKKGARGEWELRRNIAANLFDQSKEPAEIAVILGVDDQTVRRWRREYRKGGRAALASVKASGRPPRLSPDQKQELSQWLLKTPKECGFDKYLWTQQLIADLILQKFGVAYHHDHVGIILRELGFTHQKPQRRARERDEAKIQGWRQETWPALLKKASRTRG